MVQSDSAAAWPNEDARAVNGAEAAKYCDIVMKGGITSGVVYPIAVHELSQIYTFKNIGGTSAGGIAAAVTAAAQYEANHGSREGFKELEKLPAWLGATSQDRKNSNLFSLFQPQAQTRAIFRVLTAGLGNKCGSILRVISAALRNYPLAAIFGAAPGLILALLACVYASGLLLLWSLFSAILLIVIVVIISVAFALYRHAKRAIPDNFFGICSGSARTNSNAPLPLTTWLSELINHVAGKPEKGEPLTFGDLWGTSDPEARREINLQMMTTNLTHGRPYRLPFEENIFYFNPDEFGQLFPPEVVKWMVEHPRQTDGADRYASLRPLPAAADLPVVFATRLSLSFPILLSAVPLYAVDFSRNVPEAERRPERCWFSDGGISSNFPVHFFDSMLPRWPTFAINLRDYHPDFKDPVWMPDKNRGGILEWWTRFDEPTCGKVTNKLFGFFGAILNAMQNWTDNSQLRLPGYRDRIVHISLDDEKEGGLNLNMSLEVIAELGERGRQAAKELIRHYVTDNPQIETSWDNHRWVRYRSAMSLIEIMLGELLSAYNNPLPGDRSYIELINRADDIPPNSYRWSTQSQREFAIDATGQLIELAQKWESRGECIGGRMPREKQVPRPMAELRVRPRI